jgi:uncharacterized protein Yka (UPF0111/DUF47 family)
MASEYYDFDTDRRRRRSLAEESLSEQMLSLARLVSRSTMLMRDVVAALTAGDDVRLRDLHTKANQVKEQAESMKEDALTYLARLGDLLPTSTLYRDVFLNLARVAQMTEGVVYRAYVLSTKGALGSETLRDLVSSLASTLHHEFEKLENAIQLLPSNPKRSYEEAQMISSLEDQADELYRQLTMTMYNELRDDIVALMLMKDIVDMAEDIADIIRDAGEDIKFLALRQAQQT